MRCLEGRSIDHPAGIEQHQICDRSLVDTSAIPEHEAVGRKGRHLAYR
jgi:hypothetical protein